ncbi:phosphatidylglycerophosphatase A [candidate division KSB1 bacterium]|nr:phosphatidylglycerophosphatase A [candidate division KSB1 bacterium]
MKRLVLADWLAVTLCGIGHSPIAPATVASLAVCVSFWFVPLLTTWPWILLIVPLTWWGAALARKSIDAFDVVHAEQFAALRRPNPHKGDPDQFVFDEFIGQWITLIAAPHTMAGYALAFFAFRGFDILKPLGIRSFERLPNGWGVVLDDVVAGIYGAISLFIIQFVARDYLPGWYTGM